eukprot:Skav229270  [mRNA]  locus=scaffold952:186213:187874:- [translate_table: standard]
MWTCSLTFMHEHVMAQETFGHLVELTSIADATDALPAMVEQGWTTPSAVLANRAQWDLLKLEPQQLLGLQTAVEMWFHSKPPASVAAPGPRRHDFPVMKPRSSGSLDAALQAALMNQREESLRIFHDEIYAKSNANTTDSRLKTWRKIAEAWHIPPWPLTVDTVWKIGASLKAGGYKSSKLYFSAASKFHTLHHGELTAATKVAIRDATRSIERGLGGPQLKDAFELEALRQVFRQQDFDEFAGAYCMTVAGTWFLTREIELAAAQHRHIRFDSKALTVHWTLPMSKTDQHGQMIERTHACACGDAREPLCPYHALHDWCHRQDVILGDSPLFPDPKGGVLSKYASIETIRFILAKADIPLTRLGPTGSQDHRFHGHCLRVSGAQFLARHQVPLHTILLMGRWASRAVERYVQEAALTKPTQPLMLPTNLPTPHTPARTQPATPKRPKLENQNKLKHMEEKIQEMAAKLKNLNVPPPYIQGRKVHLPDPREMMANPAEWATKCGWRYGVVKFLRVSHADPPCQKCFPSEKQEEDEASSETGEEESSSSEQSSD